MTTGELQECSSSLDVPYGVRRRKRVARHLATSTKSRFLLLSRAVPLRSGYALGRAVLPIWMRTKRRAQKYSLDETESTGLEDEWQDAKMPQRPASCPLLERLLVTEEQKDYPSLPTPRKGLLSLAKKGQSSMSPTRDAFSQSRNRLRRNSSTTSTTLSAGTAAPSNGNGGKSPRSSSTILSLSNSATAKRLWNQSNTVTRGTGNCHIADSTENAQLTRDYLETRSLDASAGSTLVHSGTGLRQTERKAPLCSNETNLSAVSHSEPPAAVATSRVALSNGDRSDGRTHISRRVTKGDIDEQDARKVAEDGSLKLTTSRISLTRRLKPLDRIKVWFGHLTKLTKQMKAAEESCLELELVDSSFGADLVKLMKSANTAVKGLPFNIKQKIGARKERLLTRAEKVWRKLQNAKAKRVLHKLCFVVVLYDIVVSSFWLGKMPETYYLWHTIKYLILMGIRFVLFRCYKWHYYLFDFCYYANALLLLALWLWPRHSTAWRINLGFNGILSLSVYVFRDSLVPHSLQKVTSAANHFSPLVVFWTLRWFDGAPKDGNQSRFAIPTYESYKDCWREGFVETLMAYICWGVLYYTKMFVVSELKIEQRNYATLYKYLAIEQGILWRLPQSLQQHGKVVFMACHFGLFVAGYAIVSAFVTSFYLHTLLVAGVLCIQTYNGASFYMDHFAKHYESQLTLVEQMQEQMQRSRSKRLCSSGSVLQHGVADHG